MDAIRFGRGVRALRQRRGWRQEDLAGAAVVSRSVVARVEQGRGDRVPHVTLARIATALGARVVTRLEWQNENLDRLIDAEHAAITNVVVTELVEFEWACATEVTFSRYGERGSIDVLAFHAGAAIVLVVEVKSAIPEIGNLLLPLDRKARLAPLIAADRGWQAAVVARLLVVRDGRTARRRIERHRAIFDSAFPVRGWAVRRWLKAPQPVRGWSGLWLLANDHDAVAATAE